jgi:uncharacterized membrane protein
VLSLILAALFFIGIHLGIAGTVIRDHVITILSENGYRAGFAIATLIGLGWLVAAYNRAPYLVTWGMLEWWKPIAIILMLPAALLVVIGLTTPNPTAVAQEGRVGQPPRGIVRVTRHPFLTGVGLWALVHLIGNGDVASLCVALLFRDLDNRSPRRHRVDRCKAPTAPGCRLGAICRADLHCSIRRHRGRAEPVHPS